MSVTRCPHGNTREMGCVACWPKTPVVAAAKADPTRPWRVGRKVGRTLYIQKSEDPADGDELIGMMDTPELAAQVVDAVNQAAALEDALREIFALIDEGLLVRDISRDHEPGWAVRSMELVGRLKQARAVLEDAP
jgi:hypothetical protein